MEEHKECPRCRGFLIVMEDRYEKYLDCLNCGWQSLSQAPDDLPPSKRRQARRKYMSRTKEFA